MAASDNNNKTARWRTTTHATRHEDLQRGMPASLRAAPAPSRPFLLARDPYAARQLADMEKTEAQWRGEGGRGSQMVKLHKPFPQLKPKDDLARDTLKQTFDRAWLREQREARMASLQAQRVERRARDRTNDHSREGPDHGLHR